MGFSRGRWATFAGVVAVFLAAASSTRAYAADSDDPEKLIKRGNDLRRQGDNIRAFGYLQRAHELAGTPRTGAQLGLCEQALGRFADAEVHLTGALSTNDAWVDANRASLESSRATARKKLGKVQITGAPAGTTVAVGSAAAQKLPSDGAIWVAPGAVNLTLEAPGFRTATKQSSVAEGGTATVASGLVAVAPTNVAVVVPPSATSTGGSTSGATTGDSGRPPASTPSTADTGGDTPPATAQTDDGKSGLRITGLAIAGGGVAVAVVGAVVLNMGLKKRDALEGDANATPPRPYNPDNANWKTLQTSGIALLAVGGAALVTGGVIYLVNRSDDAAQPSGAATASRRRPSLANAFSFGWTPAAGARVGFATSF